MGSPRGGPGASLRETTMGLLIVALYWLRRESHGLGFGIPFYWSRSRRGAASRVSA